MFLYEIVLAYNGQSSKCIFYPTHLVYITSKRYLYF